MIIVRGEPDETVTQENFVSVRHYLFNAINKGRMTFSDWPLENLQNIPDTPDPDGGAVTLLAEWIERHLLKKTRLMMFADLREAQFEAAKRAAEVILSQETRNALKDYRDKEFGEKQGSMELAVKQLLKVASQALPQDAFLLLEAYRQRNGLKTPADAIRALVDLAEKHQPPQDKSLNFGSFLHQEVKKLLHDLKSPTAATGNTAMEG